MPVLQYSCEPETSLTIIAAKGETADQARSHLAAFALYVFQETAITDDPGAYLKDAHDFSKTLESISDRSKILSVDAMFKLADIEETGVEGLYIVDENNQMLDPETRELLTERASPAGFTDPHVSYSTGTLSLNRKSFTIEPLAEGATREHTSLGREENGSYVPFITILNPDYVAEIAYAPEAKRQKEIKELDELFRNSPS